MTVQASLDQGRIPRGVWILGFVSLLMDVSSEMIHSLLPLFMANSLEASALLIGLVEGIGESVALIVKVFSGVLSDYLGKRKGLAVLGYTLGALSKPLFAMAPAVSWVLTARVVDRIGKGIRGAPRDALIADLTPHALMGAAFGLRQSLDTIGAFMGPLIAVILMLLWGNDYRAVFWVAIIPGLFSAGLLWVGLREPPHREGMARGNPIRLENLRLLGLAYWATVLLAAVFTLARFSEAFLVLKAQQTGIDVALVPLVMVAMNVVYALSAYPFGKLSDRWSSRWILSLGVVILILADGVLAIADDWRVMMGGMVLWGLHLGITQGVLSALVGRAAPTHLRGTAFGLFNLVSGVSMLMASLLAGLVWDRHGSSATFLLGLVFCLISLFLILLSSRIRQSSK